MERKGLLALLAFFFLFSVSFFYLFFVFLFLYLLLLIFFQVRVVSGELIWQPFFFEPRCVIQGGVRVMIYRQVSLFLFSLFLSLSLSSLSLSLSLSLFPSLSSRHEHEMRQGEEKGIRISTKSFPNKFSLKGIIFTR